MDLIYVLILGILLEKYIFPLLDLKFNFHSNEYNIKALKQEGQAKEIQDKQAIKSMQTKEEILAIDYDIAIIEKDINVIRGVEPQFNDSNVCGFKYEHQDDYPEDWDDEEWDDCDCKNSNK